MALERQTIEKKDFPIGRRGYDPDAVDEHLRSLADEVDELKRSARRRTETLASTASEQVRAIVEAAESSAAEIQRQAEDEARDIRSEAASEAESTREQATAQAREYVGKVSESTAVMMQRLDAMESELSALIESLRTGSNRLNADLQLLETNLSEVSEAVAPSGQFEPEAASEPEAPAAVAAETGLADLSSEPASGDFSGAAFEAEAVEGEEPLGGADVIEEPLGAETSGFAGEAEALAEEPAAEAAPGDGSDDTEGARLIALNMALNGTPRDETDRYLAENFELSDRASLLDEVYASVEG